MIRDVFENGHGIAAIPISVYVALTELASDAQSETFTAPISQIARRACVSYRTAFAFLKRFESVKLIAVDRLRIEGTKERLPSTYTLLSPLMHAVHNPCANAEPSRLPRYKKNRKNRKNPDDMRTHARTREAAPGARGRKSSSSIFLSLEEAKKDLLWPQFENYCVSNNGSPTLNGWKTWRPKQSANEARPRLTAMRSKELQSLRSKLVAERNSGKLSREEKHARRKQLLQIKQILKRRGIEYPASI